MQLLLTTEDTQKHSLAKTQQGTHERAMVMILFEYEHTGYEKCTL